jgi:hypothetical protein
MKRGGPLQRYTPLVAKTGLRRVTPMQQKAGREQPGARKSAPRKVSGPVGPPADVVAAVVERERESCLICGYGVGPNERGRRWSIHHRLRRGQQVQHTVQNCILLCGGSEVDGCHQVVHANPAASREGGWLIRGRAEPLAIPVLLPIERRLVYLTSTGLYHDVRKEGAS